MEDVIHDQTEDYQMGLPFSKLFINVRRLRRKHPLSRRGAMTVAMREWQLVAITTPRYYYWY